MNKEYLRMIKVEFMHGVEEPWCNNAYFISKTLMLVFQVWELEKFISETIWIKSDNEKWQFYIKTLDEKFNKSFSLSKIIEIEKDFVLKTFKEKQNLEMFSNL